MHTTDPALYRVMPEDLETVWPAVAERIADVAARSNGDWTEETIVKLILTGAWHLWLVWDGRVQAVIAGEIHLAPSGRKVFSIRFTTGENSHTWLHLIDDLEQWAASEGCEAVKITARKGWAKRLADYRMTHVLLEKELDNGRIRYHDTDTDADQKPIRADDTPDNQYRWADRSTWQ